MVDTKRYAHNGYSTCLECLQMHLSAYPTFNHRAGLRADSSLRCSIILSFHLIEYHIWNTYIKFPFYVRYGIISFQVAIADLKSVKANAPSISHDKNIEYNVFCQWQAPSLYTLSNEHRVQEIRLAQFTEGSFTNTIPSAHYFVQVRYKNLTFGSSEVKATTSFTRILNIPQWNISLISDKLSYNQVN